MTVDETTYGSAYTYGGDFEVHPAGTAVEIERLRTALEAQAARIAELEELLRQARDWMSRAVGDSWVAHDAVDPLLFGKMDAALPPEVKP